MEYPPVKPPPEGWRRFRLDLSFHGQPFSGWQKQQGQASVQGELESALKKLYGQSIEVIGAGRTDAGVHALQQVAHADLPIGEKGPKTHELKKALNATTIEMLTILSTMECEPTFHARFNPHIKTYAYHIDLNQHPMPMLLDRAYHTRYKVEDIEIMETFLQMIVGTHDFGSFCSAHNSTPTTIRTLVGAELKNVGLNHWIMRVKGKGFLQHMVRILAGTMISLGGGELKLDFIAKVLKEGQGFREQLGNTLPAKGLWLESTEYIAKEVWKSSQEDE